MNIKDLEKAVGEYNKANENDKRMLIHIAPRTITVNLSDEVTGNGVDDTFEGTLTILDEIQPCLSGEASRILDKAKGIEDKD